MRRWIGPFLGTLAVCAAAVAGACVAAQPAADTGAVALPTSPSGAPLPLAYNPDMKSLFDGDCVYCHGGYRTDGKYRMTTYQEVMVDVHPGSPQGDLVRETQPQGTMYIYFSGNEATRQLKAKMVLDWVVTYLGRENR
jgi:hypothetical protein